MLGRSSATLTGGGVTDYSADLDLDDTFDSEVTVEIQGSTGSLQSVLVRYHAGPEPLPDAFMVGPMGLEETITEASWSRVITLQVHARYFRVGLTGNGQHPEGSDAVVTYYYQPNVVVQRIIDGIPKLIA